MLLLISLHLHDNVVQFPRGGGLVDIDDQTMRQNQKLTIKKTSSVPI